MRPFSEWIKSTMRPFSERIKSRRSSIRLFTAVFESEILTLLNRLPAAIANRVIESEMILASGVKLPGSP